MDYSFVMILSMVLWNRILWFTLHLQQSHRTDALVYGDLGCPLEPGH